MSTLFTDEDFPPNTSSITDTYSYSYSNSSSKYTINNIKLDMIEWKRLSDIYSFNTITIKNFLLEQNLNQSKEEYLLKKVLFQDVLYINNAYGDFYSVCLTRLPKENLSFTSVLYIILDYLIKLNPYYILRLFDVEKSNYLNGYYVLRLYIKENWEEVIIDDYIPVLINTRKSLFYNPSSLNEVWVILIEKAIAKVNKSFLWSHYKEDVCLYDKFVTIFHMITSIKLSKIQGEALDSNKKKLFFIEEVKLNTNNFSSEAIKELFQMIDYDINNVEFSSILSSSLNFCIPFILNEEEEGDLNNNRKVIIETPIFNTMRYSNIIKEILYNLYNNDYEIQIKKQIFSTNPKENDKILYKYSIILNNSMEIENFLKNKTKTDYFIDLNIVSSLQEEEVFIGNEFKIRSYSDSYENEKYVSILNHYYEIKSLLYVVNKKRKDFSMKFNILLSKKKYKHRKDKEKDKDLTDKSLFVTTLLDEELLMSLSNRIILQLQLSYDKSRLLDNTIINETSNYLSNNEKQRKSKKNLCFNIDFNDIFWSKRYYNNGFYIGQINESNKFHGIGAYIWKTGEAYYGSWKNGLRNGYGIEYVNELIIYEGEFEEGLRSGVGELYLSNTDIYQGEFNKGLYEGQGIYYWSRNKAKYIGRFLEGRQHGTGILVTEDFQLVKQYNKGKSIRKSMNNEEETEENTCFS